MKAGIFYFIFQALFIATWEENIRINFPVENESAEITTLPSSARSNLVHRPLPSKCGDRLTEGAQPWIARLGYQTESGEKLECLGVLINSRYVVTTSACLSEGRSLSKIVLGESRSHRREGLAGNGPTSCSRPPLEVGVESIERFSHHPSSNGIGLVRLDRHIPFDSVENCNIQAICLPPENLDLMGNLIHGQQLMGAGWALSSARHTSSKDTLQSFGIPLINSEKCSKKFGVRFSSEKHICGRDLCLISGSPLILPDREMMLVGLASFGEPPCVQGSHPASYVSVNSYRNWIVDNLSP